MSPADHHVRETTSWLVDTERGRIDRVSRIGVGRDWQSEKERRNSAQNAEIKGKSVRTGIGVDDMLGESASDDEGVAEKGKREERDRRRNSGRVRFLEDNG